MNEHTRTTGYALARGLEMGALGYKVVPIPAGEKYPKGFGKWQEIATDDTATITGWFADTTHGIGWAMGRQPNGQFVFAIDVEAEGIDTLIELLKQHGQEPFFNTACQATGGAGMHFVFTSEVEVFNSARQFAAKIDVRGEGGQILIGPTIHPNGNPYQWQKFPDERRPLPAPVWVMDRIHEMSSYQAKPPTPPKGLALALISTGGRTVDISPADWVREMWSINDMLNMAGWQYMESRGDDHYWCRPGKNPAKGHSAILHGEGPLVVWSTEVEWRGGRDNRDGSISYSPFEVYAHLEHGGDTALAAKHLRNNVMPRPRKVGTGAPDTDATERTHAAGLNLPSEFWGERPWLAHILQAADARLVSPDALLMSVVARVAALIPPEMQLPGIVGSNATLDWIGCVVSTSSGGKTISNGVAAELVPNIATDVLMDASPGSGEGLIQAFMGYEKDESGKKIGDPSWKFGEYHAIHLTVDEGTGLMEQQSRKGTTIVQTLCSAWSGATLGQLNASIETRRFVPARKRRVTATVNIQTGFGHRLLAEDLRHIGLPQRMMFAWAHSTPPDTQPEWPGTLTFQRPHIMGNVSFFDVADEVRIAIITNRRQQMLGQVVMDELDGHGYLAQLKLAAIFATIESRREVTLDDWNLASQVAHSHRAVRSHLLRVRSQQIRDASTTAATLQAEREITVDSVKERQAIARLSDRIVAVVALGELSRTALRKRVCSASTKHRLDDALAQAVDRGAVEIVPTEGTGEAGWVVRSV